MRCDVFAISCGSRTRGSFIPLHRWPRLVLSIFQFHNETANIWTHLAPLLLSLSSLPSSVIQVFELAQSGNQFPVDIAEHLFTLFANICLLSSCVWHVISGCAHMGTAETAARVDYVGIGWYGILEGLYPSVRYLM